MNTAMAEEMKKSSSPPHPPHSHPYPTSFWSLPNDVILNVLARVSIFHRPTLSLVSKSFQSLMSSQELEATRTRLGITDRCLYVCITLNKKNPDPRWFMVAPLTKQQKLVPVPLFPHKYAKSSTVVSLGSEIYIIGGLSGGERSKRVLLLDCNNHHWSILPHMLVGRARPAVDVIDGKIYVIGGCEVTWGEVYDPRTQTWEPKTLDLTFQKRIVPGRLVMGGKLYNMNAEAMPESFLAEVEEKQVLRLVITDGKLFWRAAQETEDLGFWSRVLGLEKGLPCESIYPINLISVANPSEGKKGSVTVWWKTSKFGRQCRCNAEGCKTEIWCAEIALKRPCGSKEVWGFVEWSKKVFTADGCDSRPDFLLESVVVTIPHLKVDRLISYAPFLLLTTRQHPNF